MKKYLLIPTLATIFAVPAFSAFPGADMNNTNIEGNTTSSNMPSQSNDRMHKKHGRNNDDTMANSNSENTPVQKHQARLAQEANTDMDENESKSNHQRPKHHKKPKHNQQTLDHDNQKDDDNDNLRDIARPETNNINSNLRIPDGESSRLNREMMLDGPQGGFQNNQPRGIGSR